MLLVGSDADLLIPSDPGCDWGTADDIRHQARGPGPGSPGIRCEGETVMSESEYGGNGDPAHSSESQAHTLRRVRWIIKFNGLLDQSM